MDHSSPPPAACADPSLGRGAEPLLLRLRQDPPAPASTSAARGPAPVTAAEHLASLTAAFTPYLRPELPHLIEEVATRTHIRERWSTELFPGMPFGVYVLRTYADRAPAPTVLALHGHGASSHALVGEHDGGATASAHARLGERLAEAGANVVVPDVLGLPGRLGTAERAETQCQRLVNHLGLFGLCLAGARAAELTALLGQLSPLGLDPAAPLGVAGFSGGAQVGLHVALTHPAVRAVAMAGYGSTFAQSILAIDHCPCNYTPGLARFGELPDLIRGFDGRVLVEAGREDPLFPISGVRATAEALARPERAGRGGEDRVGTGSSGVGQCEVFEHDGGHEVDGTAMIPRLIETLEMPSH